MKFYIYHSNMNYFHRHKLMAYFLSLALSVMVAELVHAQEEAEEIKQTENLEDVSLPILKDRAARGNADAQNEMGLRYYYGRGGVGENYEQSVYWWKKAAPQGHSDAQYNLAWMYAFGEGINEDYVLAYAWGSLAVAQGHKAAADAKDYIEDELTDDALKKAKEIAKGLQAKIETIIDNPTP